MTKTEKLAAEFEVAREKLVEPLHALMRSTLKDLGFDCETRVVYREFGTRCAITFKAPPGPMVTPTTCRWVWALWDDGQGDQGPTSLLSLSLGDIRMLLEQKKKQCQEARK